MIKKVSVSIAVIMLFCSFSFTTAAEEGRVVRLRIYSPEHAVDNQIGSTVIAIILDSNPQAIYCYLEEVGSSSFDKIFATLLYAYQHRTNYTVICHQNDVGHIKGIELNPW